MIMQFSYLLLSAAHLSQEVCKVLKKTAIWVRPGMWAHSEVFEAAGKLVNTLTWVLLLENKNVIKPQHEE